MFLKFINFASNLIIPPGSTEALLGDFLADNTVKLRRWLLGLTAVSFYMSKAHMVPTKISALGIEFSGVNQQQFLKISGYILLYFLCSFLVYALIDLSRWVHGLMEVRKKYFDGIMRSTLAADSETDPDDNKIERSGRLRKKFIEPIEDVQMFGSSSLLALSLLRVALDILLPLGVGVYSLILLW